MRSIAIACGLSPAAVSMALRNSSEISPDVRAKVQAAARKLGYRPDPILTHLMQHLRESRTVLGGATIAVLVSSDAPFVKRLVAGAQARALRLGYTLDRIDLRRLSGNPHALTRMLVARGIVGVLIPPAVEPTDYSHLLDWSKFAAVAMTYSVTAPRIHRVVTHHYDNAFRTFALLEQRGYRRIGLAMTRDMEFRANHSYSGAYFRRRLDSGSAVLPILFIDSESAAGMQRWFDKHRPDVIVMANSHQFSLNLNPALGAKRCAQTAFATLDRELNAEIAGIDQLFEIVGSHAIDAVVAQIHRNEQGLPAHPTITMVEGEWMEDTAKLPPLPVGGTERPAARKPTGV